MKPLIPPNGSDLPEYYRNETPLIDNRVMDTLSSLVYGVPKAAAQATVDTISNPLPLMAASEIISKGME